MTFSEVTGHTGNISFLERSVLNSRVAPVYLFSGPGSIGKRKVAVSFAKLEVLN